MSSAWCAVGSYRKVEGVLPPTMPPKVSADEARALRDSRGSTPPLPGSVMEEALEEVEASAGEVTAMARGSEGRSVGDCELQLAEVREGSEVSCVYGGVWLEEA